MLYGFPTVFDCFPVVFLWVSYGFLLVFYWFSIVFLLFSYGMMVFYGFPGLAGGSLAEYTAHSGSQGRIASVFYGLLLRFYCCLWFSYGFLMGSVVFFDVLWFSYGSRLFSCGFLMGFYCFPMVFLWFSIGFLWFSLAFLGLYVFVVLC